MKRAPPSPPPSRHYMSCHEPRSRWVGPHLLGFGGEDESGWKRPRSSPSFLPLHNHGNQHHLHHIALLAEKRQMAREVRRGDRRSSSARASWNVFDTNRIISGPRRRMKMVMDAAGIHNYPTAMRLRFYNPKSYRRRDKYHSSPLASSRAPLPQPPTAEPLVDSHPHNSSR